jgi:hypothetical protein
MAARERERKQNKQPGQASSHGRLSRNINEEDAEKASIASAYSGEGNRATTRAVLG